MAEAGADPAVKVIVRDRVPAAGFAPGSTFRIIGAGAGGRVETDPRHRARNGAMMSARRWRAFLLAAGTALITCRKPTIAAVNGPAFGWGFILSLHCDIRFAARSALFNATFARIGVPGERARRGC